MNISNDMILYPARVSSMTKGGTTLSTILFKIIIDTTDHIKEDNKEQREPDQDAVSGDQDPREEPPAKLAPT
jgi:hypothetical protein